MESRARGITVFGILSTAFLALVASFALKDGSKSSLYCVPKDSLLFISTLNPALPQAKCFRSQHGFFTEVMEDYPTLNDEEILLLDGYVLPGIIESHGHILQYGEMLESVSLFGAESIDDVRTRIKGFLSSHKGEGYGTRNKWIRGVGWDQAHFGGVMPTAVCLLLSDFRHCIPACTSRVLTLYRKSLARILLWLTSTSCLIVLMFIACGHLRKF